MEEINIVVAAFVTRAFLGILFVMQAYDKIFILKMPSVFSTVNKEYEKVHIPFWLTRTIIFFTSYVEFFAGILLVLGLYKYIALYALSLDLLIVAFSFSLIKPMWDMQHVFPRFILLITLLVIPPGWDQWALDYLLNL